MIKEWAKDDTKKDPFRTNVYGEILALDSLCKQDAMLKTTVYHEDKWINELFGCSFGETPTEAYENVEKFLKNIDGIVIRNTQERKNSNIVFDITTKYYIYTYKTEYHFTEDGVIVTVRGLDKYKRMCSDNEWKNYVGGNKNWGIIED